LFIHKVDKAPTAGLDQRRVRASGLQGWHENGTEKSACTEAQAVNRRGIRIISKPVG
jgi:hypothetical protein